MKNASKINSVQLLRAIAIMLVVYAHSIDAAINAGLSSTQASFYYLENWGAIGVDLFFVISGFIMTVILPLYMHANGWKTFFRKRLLRILPLYYLISAYLIFRTALDGHALDVSDVLISFFILPVFDTTTFSIPYIAVGWSLAYELYFYIIIAFLLAFAHNKIFRYILFLIPTISLIGFLTDADYILFKFVTSPLLLEFGLGIVAGLIYKNVVNTSMADRYLRVISVAVFIAGLVAISFTIFIDTRTISEVAYLVRDNNVAMQRAFIWGVSCFLFLLGVVLVENAFRIKIPKLFVSMGDASYSCYLVHTWFVIPHIMTLMLQTPLDNGDVSIIVSVLISLFFSLPFYYIVERNINRFAIRLSQTLHNVPQDNYKGK